MTELLKVQATAKCQRRRTVPPTYRYTPTTPGAMADLPPKESPQSGPPAELNETWPEPWPYHNLQDVCRVDANGNLYPSRAFGRAQANQARNQNQPPSRGNVASPSAYNPSSLGTASIPQAPPSPSLSQTMMTNEQAHQANLAAKKVPIFFREEHAGFIVKGNFMTLAAKPHLVEEGEWMAHQSE